MYVYPCKGKCRVIFIHHSDLFRILGVWEIIRRKFVNVFINGLDCAGESVTLAAWPPDQLVFERRLLLQQHALHSGFAFSLGGGT